MYTVVDLFAGAGGLSLGFMQTGKFSIKVAFENSPYMQDTYRLNHPGVEVQGDVCAADYSDIQKRYGKIDIVIGGPPCQGFSNANRQKNTAISQNNMLVKQYIRAILELKPKAFVMENVSMLRSEIHRFYMERRDEEIVARCEIPVKTTALQLIDRDFCFDGAIDIVQDENLIRQHLWTESTYAKLNVVYKAAKNTDKLIKALNKHKKAILQAAEFFVSTTNRDYISVANKNAFQAILDYYAETVCVDQLKGIILCSRSISVCVGLQRIVEGMEILSLLQRTETFKSGFCCGCYHVVL